MATNERGSSDMTRIEAEEAILKKLKEVREIALKYSPETKVLSCGITKHGITVDNDAAVGSVGRVLSVFCDPDGKTYHWDLGKEDGNAKDPT